MEKISLLNNQKTMYKLPDNGEREFLPFRSGTSTTTFKKIKNDIGFSGVEKKAKLRKAAESFEAIFIRQMLRSMRSTLLDGGMFGSGATGEIYSDIMENAIAEKMAERSVLGLADLLYKRMVKNIDTDNTSSGVENRFNPVKGEALK